MHSIWLSMSWVIIGISLCDSAPTAVTEFAESDVDGHTLIDFGKYLNSSLLKLIGNALVNTEKSLKTKLCKIDDYTCSKWTSWSYCSAVLNKTFGLQTRSRICGSNTSECTRTENDTSENESRVCEGFCRPDYNMSRHNFCLKINTTYLSQQDAERQCQQEGGHLMNIDTEDRWTDFVQLATYTGSIWIDGTRTVRGGSWTYLIGTDPDKNGLDHWGIGQPSNGSTELCKVGFLYRGTRYFYDYSCASRTIFICEIRGS